MEKNYNGEKKEFNNLLLKGWGSNRTSMEVARFGEDLFLLKADYFDNTFK